MTLEEACTSASVNSRLWRPYGPLSEYHSQMLRPWAKRTNWELVAFGVDTTMKPPGRKCVRFQQRRHLD